MDTAGKFLVKIIKPTNLMNPNINIITDWNEIGLSSRHRTKFKAHCHNCYSTRKDKRDKPLSVSPEEGVAYCHYCQAIYLIKKPLVNNNHHKIEKTMEKRYTKPQWKNNTNLSAAAVKWFASRGIAQQTITDMKITEGMEYMPQQKGEINTIQFNYFDGDELVNTKYRTGLKDFKFISNAELIPYNINGILNTSEIYITEGEIDALTLIQLGLPTISVPNGASDNTSYLNRFMEPLLMDKETVYIAVDTDIKGVTLRDALVRRFGPERCKVVNNWGAGCKDANECLMNYGMDGLKAMLARAEYVPVPDISRLLDFEIDLDELFEKGLQKGLTIGHANFDELCSFETKRIAVITGMPGSGKSEFMDEIATLLNLRYDWKFGYFSPENFPLRYHASKIISKITGKPFSRQNLPEDEYSEAKAYVNDNFFFICPKEKFTLDTILDRARYLVRRYGVRGIVLDPWNRLEHLIPPGMTETAYISEALDTISNFAQREDVLVFIVAHPTKLKKMPGRTEYDAPTMYDISGSANFANKADYGISVHRYKNLGYTEVIVQKVKFRHLGGPGTAMFKFNQNNGRYVPIADIQEKVNFEHGNLLRRKFSDYEF